MSAMLMGDQRGHPSGGGVFGWTPGRITSEGGLDSLELIPALAGPF